MKADSVASSSRISGSIYSIREQQVMLDEDLATLYGVQVKALNQAVKRNADRFPDDFMFQLTADELERLRSHSVTSKNRGGRRYLPYAFTEQGVAMLSSVLRSPRAVRVNIEIMRTFVNLRRHAMTIQVLNRKLTALESKYDSHFKVVFDAIRKLMQQEKPKRTLGFARKKLG